MPFGQDVFKLESNTLVACQISRDGRATTESGVLHRDEILVMNPSIDRPLWCDADGLRIWRSPESDFYGDEIRQAPAVYTDEVFEGIAAAGFNAIWIRGKLRNLCRSSVLPELNGEAVDERFESLRKVVERGERHGVQVFLFFNEPLAVPAHESFWQKYPELAGQRHRNYDEQHDVLSLCTSTPLIQQYLREAVEALLSKAVGLGGVILITASEYHTHCWSHHAIYSLNDGLHPHSPSALDCPRCRDRSPAEIVGELVTIWRDAAGRCSPTPRVLCWNWSWSMWYPDPQAEVFECLPDDIEILLDLERGTRVKRGSKTLTVDEYALSVVGPGERFCESKQVAERRGFLVHAKVQFGTTHEIATVPNLPLINQLHAKLVQLSRHRVVGIMGTWNFGCSLTLNTAAVTLYCENPCKYEDSEAFTSELARWYLGVEDTASARQAWRVFGEAFEHYPFSMAFLYLSPLNDAPVFPFRLRYEAKPMGGSWVVHEWGDRLEDSLTPGMTATEMAEALNAVADRWREGLALFEKSLESASGNKTQQLHRTEELSCARMIRVQIRSAANIYRFHAWRQDRMQKLGLQSPCDIPLNEQGRAILISEHDLTRQARELCLDDSRLGRHQECQAYFYHPETIGCKIQDLQVLIGC